jgi:uncharacterized protein YfaS (alpha-2-macroglobulin family)
MAVAWGDAFGNRTHHTRVAATVVKQPSTLLQFGDTIDVPVTLTDTTGKQWNFNTRCDYGDMLKRINT